MTQQQLKEKYYPLYIGAKAITYAALHKYYDVLNLINILEFIDKDESKLILKPLSDITDEDAIEVVKVLLHNPDSFENSDLLVMAKHILFDSSFIEYSYVKIINAINLLRSRHYDIDNLIDQRIAIDENSLNQ